MSRGAEITEHSLEVPALEKETVRLARLTVAAHAADAEDCARLLDILGIRPVVEAAAVAHPVSEKPPRPKLSTTVPNRPVDEPYVPVGHLHAVVDQVSLATGWSRREIARKAGLAEKALESICAPSNRRQFARESLYVAVSQLAERVSG